MSTLRDSIIIGLIGLFCLVLVIVLLTLSTTFNSWYSISLLILLSLVVIVVIVLFSYQLWLAMRSPKMLIIGDKQVNNEKIITDYDINLFDESTSINIVPQAVIDQDSPRGRQLLKRLKGSFLRPPKLLITMNIKQLLKNNEGELTVLSINLGRVLHQLKHEKRRQQVDVIFSHMNEITGYVEFKGVASLSMQFSTQSSLEEQLYKAQNTTDALTEYPAENFMQFLAFSRFIPNLSATADKLLSDLLLTGKSANTKVYLVTV